MTKSELQKRVEEQEVQILKMERTIKDLIMYHKEDKEILQREFKQYNDYNLVRELMNKLKEKEYIIEVLEEGEDNKLKEYIAKLEKHIVRLSMHLD